MKLASTVILSYNRQDILRRQLLYYANKPIHLVLADGSDADWGSGASGSIGEMTWEYFRISGYHTYLKRMAEGCRRVDTEFMFFVDDEECALWTGVREAIKFLKQNRDHSCAGGRVDTTALSKRRLSLVPHYGVKNKFSLVDSDPLTRIRVLIEAKRKRAVHYQVTRSASTLRIATVMEDISMLDRSPSLIEYLFLVSLFLTGKYQPKDYPFYIRNGGSVQKLASDLDYLSLSDATLGAQKILVAYPDLIENKTLREKEIVISELVDTFLAIRPQRPKFAITGLAEEPTKFKFMLIKKIGIIMHFIFDYLPKLYQLMNPNGLKTFKQYSKHYGSGSQEVKNDLLLIEKIWKKFPNGISCSNFSTLMIDNPEIDF